MQLRVIVDKLDSHSLPERKRTWLLMTLMSLALVVRVVCAQRPLADLVGLCMPDDSFYYFQIARNVARGLGSTFDGIDPTNGYHPLWMIVCAAMFKIFGPSRSRPIYAALTVGALVDAFSSYLIFVIAQRLTKSFWAGICGMLLYALGVHQVLFSVNGLETSMTVFSFLLTSLTAIRVVDKPDDTRRLLALGATWGVLFLSRTDVGAFLVPAVAWSTIRALRCKGLISVFLFALPAAVVVSPWIVWNFVTFGSLSQVSGNAYVFWNHEIFRFNHAGENVWSAELKKNLELTRGVIAHALRFSSFGKSTAVLLPTAFAIIRWQGKRQQRDTGLLLWWFWLAVVPLGLLVVFHGAYRWMIAPHYFAPLAVALLIFVVSSAAIVSSKWVLVVVLFTGIVNAFIQLSYVSRVGGYFPQQRDFFLERRYRIDRSFPVGSVIGNTDCGIHGYFSPHVVINLDCVVNNVCFDAIRRGKLYEYLLQRNVRFLLLNDYHEGYFLSKLLPKGAVTRRYFAWSGSEKLHYYEVRSGPISLDR